MRSNSAANHRYAAQPNPRLSSPISVRARSKAVRHLAAGRHGIVTDEALDGNAILISLIKQSNRETADSNCPLFKDSYFHARKHTRLNDS